MFKLNKKISKDILRATNRIHVGSICVSGLNYFVKPDQELKEVIGYYLSKLLDLSCAKYFSLKVNNKNYTVSLDLNYRFDFVLAHEFSLNGLEFTEILETLHPYPFFDEFFEKDMIRMYLYDILFMNDDRHDRNWGLYHHEPKKIILLDNGNIFSIGRKPYIRYSDEVYAKENGDQAVCEDFMLFYESLSLEDRQMVNSYLKKTSPKNIGNLFQTIENLYQGKINPLFLRIYEEHYHGIMKLVEEARRFYGR